VQFPKIWVTLHAYISRTASCTKSITARGNTLDPSTIRRNAYIRCKPKAQSWSARIGSVPKNLK